MSGWEPIPGETPIDDISGLIARHVTHRGQLNIVEAENIRRATVKYLSARPSRRQAPFTLEWTYKLHKEMFGAVWKWAGVRRTIELNMGVPHYQIDVGMEDLLRDLPLWGKSMVFEEQAARLHHRAVQIHPFLNGNGRWSRMLANIWLRRNGSLITIWPDETVNRSSTIRDEYLKAVRAADAGDLEPLIALHRKYAEPVMPNPVQVVRRDDDES